jgi:hypothetical protein
MQRRFVGHVTFVHPVDNPIHVFELSLLEFRHDQIADPVRVCRRRPPHPDILKKLAKVYEVPLRDLLVKAGYLEDESDKGPTTEQVNSAFDHVTSDPRLSYGTRLKGSKLGTDGKRLIIELYEKWTKERLLGEKGS